MKDIARFGWISDIYSQYFVTDFLQEAKDFYRQKRISFKENQMLEYLETVNILIKATNSITYVFIDNR
jgi:hypothetical protein